MVDVKRAYFYAPTRREIYTKVPEEDLLPGEAGVVGILDFSLYGTRDAAQNWAHCYGEVLTNHGFIKGRASVCNFWHPQHDISITCHGDDFMIVGSLVNLEWIIGILGKRFEIVYRVLGPEPHCSK